MSKFPSILYWNYIFLKNLMGTCNKIALELLIIASSHQFFKSVKRFPYILYWNFIFFEKFDGNLQYLIALGFRLLLFLKLSL
jgi:hypothetical protein